MFDNHPYDLTMDSSLNGQALRLESKTSNPFIITLQLGITIKFDFCRNFLSNDSYSGYLTFRQYFLSYDKRI